MALSVASKKKYPLTRPGIDPGTFRLVAQRLNHYAIILCLNIKYFNIFFVYIYSYSWWTLFCVTMIHSQFPSARFVTKCIRCTINDMFVRFNVFEIREFPPSCLNTLCKTLIQIGVHAPESLCTPIHGVPEKLRALPQLLSRRTF